MYLRRNAIVSSIYGRFWTVKFYFTSCLITWTCWGILVFSNIPYGSSGGTVIFAVGGMGPFIAAIICVNRSYGESDRRDFWKSIGKVTKRQSKWIWISVGINFGVSLLLALSEPIIVQTNFSLTSLVTQVAAVGSVVIMAVFNLVASVFEEPGWRGFAQASW